ncbi:MAG: glycerol-3-phosphate acyltransferase [Thermomicrobium sp.]|nr:glycerol-3-phosphate acyltransferase [Thermomicrobium sp.]
MVEAAALIVTGFVLGSVPTAQLAAQLIAGVDLRERSPTVSGSGVYYLVARWAVVPVGILDITKGVLATYVPYQFGFGTEMAVACGLAAIVGHNWSPWIGFRGGRGLSPFLGMLLVVFPIGALVVLGALALGRLVGRTPVGALIGLTVLPGLVIWSGGSDAALRGTLGMLLVTIVKRLEANRRPLPRDRIQRRVVLWRRFWYDRDEARWPPDGEG